ncbi:FAD-binding molybdopterin dehydrogenase [Labrys miyagiensis]|uniref:FAD-binding molybdopterin dehydrogenase n=1 Tax=Labrys miyagiensis TaxID=346912 RepID=A0ABQ6CWB1_9HYPH|nr:FAD binding domain-containing protein [Labrys miyagiensis]GLS23902.1 FAD-binding molybdopterin dehydrogenase [Labrys miyagiensis]
MNLKTIMKAPQPTGRPAVAALAMNMRKSDAWLAGGTWLFSEPQPRLGRIIDLFGLHWEPLVANARGLSIAATCSLDTLAAFKVPMAWHAASLIGACCAAFPASFTGSDMATVGGNLCLSLPSGPMIALCAALDGVCTIWMPAGGERQLPVSDFVLGPRRPALRLGEILRSIELPAKALRRHTAFRRICLTPFGRSDALLIGTLSEEDHLALTVTASTRRPLRFGFEGIPSDTALKERLAAGIPRELYYDDVHGHPDWCRDATLALAVEICEELRATLPLRAFLSGAVARPRSFGETGNS